MRSDPYGTRCLERSSWEAAQRHEDFSRALLRQKVEGMAKEMNALRTSMDERERAQEKEMRHREVRAREREEVLKEELRREWQEQLDKVQQELEQERKVRENVEQELEEERKEKESLQEALRSKEEETETRIATLEQQLKVSREREEKLAEEKKELQERVEELEKGEKWCCVSFLLSFIDGRLSLASEALWKCRHRQFEKEQRGTEENHGTYQFRYRSFACLLHSSLHLSFVVHFMSLSSAGRLAGELERRTISLLLNEKLSPDEIAIVMKRRKRMLVSREKFLSGFAKLEDDFELEDNRRRRREGDVGENRNSLEEVLGKLGNLREAVEKDEVWYDHMGTMGGLDEGDLRKLKRVLPRAKNRRNVEVHGDVSDMNPGEVRRYVSGCTEYSLLIASKRLHPSVRRHFEILPFHVHEAGTLALGMLEHLGAFRHGVSSSASSS